MIGLIVSLVFILVLSRKSLPLALVLGAVVLGIFTLPVSLMLEKIYLTITDLSIIFLALAMGVIPLIGGTMKHSGQIDDLVNNLRIGKKGLLALSPAIMGLLPMPGGALLSAPILEKGGEDVPSDLKVAINDWFRHLFVMIYPLSSALIASAKMSGMSVYSAMLYLFPTFFFALFLGIIFFIRRVEGKIIYPERFQLNRLLLPLFIILIAPVFDFLIKSLHIFKIKEIATLSGVLIALVLSIVLSQSRLDFKKIIGEMKPYNFFFIIIGMFLFLNIFKSTNAVEMIAAIPLPIATLGVVVGFLLGFATGRVLLPASIILPVYLTQASITPASFALIYTAIFFGYVISPVHPCVGVSLVYFKVSLKNFFRLLALPTAIIFCLTLFLSFVLK